jgi:NADH-quinone oxidoreductase subunit N
MSVFLFSLAGVPPLAGFQGKLLIFFSAIGVDAGPGSGSRLNQWFVGLAVIGVLNAAIAAAYYLRIVGTMYFRSPLTTHRAEGGRGAYATMLACIVLVLGIGLVPGPLLQQAEQAIARARLHAAPVAETTGAE